MCRAVFLRLTFCKHAGKIKRALIFGDLYVQLQAVQTRYIHRICGNLLRRNVDKAPAVFKHIIAYACKVAGGNCVVSVYVLGFCARKNGVWDIVIVPAQNTD